MNRLSTEKRVQIIALLVEGNSLRSTSRITGCSINTVTKLLVDVGRAAWVYQDEHLKNLTCKRIQVDEIWSFCYAKQKNVSKIKNPVDGAGDVWTWTSICPDTKLVPAWYVGNRSMESAKVFITDLSSRMANRIELTSDGYKAYEAAVDIAFKKGVDFSMLVKMYDKNRYVGAIKRSVAGNPDLNRTTTTAVERQNLTMRMGMRRFTRKTNGHSKKLENHCYALALHFIFYNYARIHQSLRVTPAMEAGISDHVWSIEEIVNLIDSNQ